MSGGGLRDRMPQCAEFVDALREAFGQTEIDNVIRRGLRPDCLPEHRVFFSVAGTFIGQPLEPHGFSVTGDDMPIITIQKGKRNA